MKRLDEASTFIVMHDQKPSFEQLRIWLDKICNDIAIKYGLLTPSGKPRKAFVLDTLLKYSCRGCIRKALQHHEADGRVDALYIQNHRLAIGLLIEGLRSIFESSGLSLNVGLEVTGDFGKSDVVVKPTWTGVSVKLETFEIIIEVKTGNGLSYSQIVRYLLENPNSVGVVWRVLPDQILVIDPVKHHFLLELCLLAAVIRGLDILNGRIEECSHSMARNPKFEIKDAQKILESYMAALEKSLPKVVMTVYEIVRNRNAKTETITREGVVYGGLF
ncbi:MAG: hypothetical protein QW660_04535 [Candidatus Bathyarchaeia archaeon]